MQQAFRLKNQSIKIDFGGVKMSNFGKIRSEENPCVRFGKLFAELYYYMGKNILEALGEEKGFQVISKAIKEFGEFRVRNMKEEAEERDVEVKDMKSFYEVRDMPDCGWVYGDEKGVVVQCLFDEVWKKYGEIGKKLQKLYCPIDHTIYGGFGFHLERPYCKADGDDICVFHITRNEDEGADKNKR